MGEYSVNLSEIVAFIKFENSRVEKSAAADKKKVFMLFVEYYPQFYLRSCFKNCYKKEDTSTTFISAKKYISLRLDVAKRFYQKRIPGYKLLRDTVEFLVIAGLVASGE